VYIEEMAQPWPLNIEEMATGPATAGLAHQNIVYTAGRQQNIAYMAWPQALAIGRLLYIEDTARPRHKQALALGRLLYIADTARPRHEYIAAQLQAGPAQVGLGHRRRPQHIDTMAQAWPGLGRLGLGSLVVPAGRPRHVDIVNMAGPVR
jgi:hypothetical protein